MEIVFRVCLCIAGIINFVPVMIAFAPGQIPASYGVEVTDASLELLLRHRAVLFGIIGGLMIFAAIKKKYYDLSLSLGLISMVSFLILFFSIDGEINSQLEKVMKIDVIGIAILVGGLFIYKLKSRNQEV